MLHHKKSLKFVPIQHSLNKMLQRIRLVAPNLLRCSQIGVQHAKLFRWNGSNAGEEKSNGDEAEVESVFAKAEFDKLLTEKDEIIKEKDAAVNDYKDKYMRSLAENENLRTRSIKLVDDAKQYGIQGFSKDLLDIADTLEKAMETIPEDKLKANKDLKDLYQGLEMTATQLQKVFNKHGVEKINPVGEKFDPNFHDALFQQPFPDKEPGTIAMVTKVGYLLHSRPLRAALVGVVQG